MRLSTRLMPILVFMAARPASGISNRELLRQARGLRFLVTGGAGFIGAHVVRDALAHGAESVWVVDNFLNGRRQIVQEIKSEVGSRLVLREGDITNETFSRQTMFEAQPDIVIHLAAHHFIPFCNAHPAETIRVNTEGTHTILRAAADAGVQSAFVASSGVVYDSREEPLSEVDPGLKTIDVYGLSKKMAEDVARQVEATTPMACPIGRIFNTYGPDDPHPHLVAHLLNKTERLIATCKETPFEIPMGNLEPKRDMIYVEDTARGVLSISLLRKKGVVINIGSGDELSVRDILVTIGRHLQTPMHPRQVPTLTRATDKSHQKADISQLLHSTGFRARNFSSGVLAALTTRKIGRFGSESSGCQSAGVGVPWQRIPRHVWQTSNLLADELPAGTRRMRAKMQRENPEYVFHLMNDAHVDAFIQSSFEPYVYRAYSSLRWGNSKGDFFRFTALYQFGGVYLDVDSSLIAPLRDLIRPDDSAILSSEGAWPQSCPREDVYPNTRRGILKLVYGTEELETLAGQTPRDRAQIAHLVPELSGKAVATFMMVSEPQHPMLAAMIHEMSTAINAWRDSTETQAVPLQPKALYLSGPCMFTMLFHRMVSSGELDPSDFRFRRGINYEGFASRWADQEYRKAAVGSAWKTEPGSTPFKKVTANQTVSTHYFPRRGRHQGRR